MSNNHFTKTILHQFDQRVHGFLGLLALGDDLNTPSH